VSGIALESGPSEGKLAELGVRDWPIWTCEVSEFPWSYDERETCYLLEGEVVVTPEGGEPVAIGVGDFVTFPEGMDCTWKVLKPVRKHYTFG
jgi:uncharacterized cupin superfamily protein